MRLMGPIFVWTLTKGTGAFTKMSHLLKKYIANKIFQSLINVNLLVIDRCFKDKPYSCNLKSDFVLSIF